MLLGGILLLSAVVAVASFAATGLWWWLPAGFLAGALGLTIVAFLFFWGMSAVVDQRKQQEHDSKFYRAVAKLYIAFLVKVLRVHIHTEGKEKLPKDGRFLLVCNHTSDADPVVLMQCFPDSQLAFISKREVSSYFLVGKFMHRLMCQPVNRENDREALKTILRCIQLLKEDEVNIAVFPEGYIRPNRKLHHFRHGVFKIATKTNVPIVVCTLQNVQRIFENMPGRKPSHIQMHLLDVIYPEQYAGMTTVEISEKIYRMMAEDLGPDLVDQAEE